MALTRVQRKTAVTSGNAASVSAVFDSAPTQNNLLIARVNSDSTGSMTSSGWTAGPSQINFSGLYLYYKIAGASESATVTWSPGASTSSELAVEEYSGNVTSLPFDKGTSASGIGGTGTTTTTAQADELAVAASGIANETAAPTGASWTNSFTATSTTGLHGVGTTSTGLLESFRNLSATGTYSTTPSATLSGGSVAWSGSLIATFKAGAAAPADNTTRAAFLGYFTPQLRPEAWFQ